MNYVVSLKMKKKKELTKEEKFFLSEVDRFETLLRVYKQRLEFLNFSADFYNRHGNPDNKLNKSFYNQEVDKCKCRINIIKTKLNEFNQR